MAEAQEFDRHGKPVREPSPPNYPDSNRRSNSAVNRVTPRTLPTQSYQQPGFANPILPRGNQQHYESRPVARALRPQELADDFARTVPVNDMRASNRFIQQNQGVLGETNIFKLYAEPAIDCLSSGDAESLRLAASYLEKYTIIKMCQAYALNSKDFLELAVNKDPATVRQYEELFRNVSKDCRARADEKGAPRPALALREKPEAGQPRRTHTDDPPREEEYEELESAVADRPGAVAAASLFDDRLERLRPEEWRAYFKVGCVFAIKTYSEHHSKPSTRGDDHSTEYYGRTKHGQRITSYVRRMVVVKTREGFCLAVPINTYRGQGLSKPGFRQNNINAHARIYMYGNDPGWLRGEPQSGKRSMVVVPHDNTQTLHEASRICFERTHSIDYNEPLMKIGMVHRDCIGYLVAYWEAENNRDSNHGRPRERERERERERYRDRDRDRRG